MTPVYDDRMTIDDDTTRLTREESRLLRNLVGVAEISEEFGIPRTTLSTWDARRETTGFPEPVERLSMGPIYDRREIVTWLKTRSET